MTMGPNGVIGKSGRWYPCFGLQHTETVATNLYDVPFVLCRNDQLASSVLPPNRLQFETVMKWCTDRYLIFEDVATGPEWEDLIER